LEDEIKNKSSYHKKQDFSVIFFLTGIIFGSPGQDDTEKKNGAPDNKLINKRQKGHWLISLVMGF
jgi:hypothetical protein